MHNRSVGTIKAGVIGDVGDIGFIVGDEVGLVVVVDELQSALK